MGTRTLVEGVDLHLQPVEAELLEQKPLEEPRRLVGEATAAKGGMNRETLEPRDPVALV